MNNIIINWAEGKVLHDPNTKVYKIADLQGENGEQILKELNKIGESKRRSPFFNVDEKIYFPDPEHEEIYVDGFQIYNGEMRAILSVKAWCERYGFFAFPMSIFRREPLREKREGESKCEFEVFCENNPFGEKMLILPNDYVRYLAVRSKCVKIKDRMTGHQYGGAVDTVTNKWKVDYNSLKPFICYKFDLIE